MPTGTPTETEQALYPQKCYLPLCTMDEPGMARVRASRAWLAQIIRTHPSYWFYKGLDSLDANQGHFARRLSPTPGLLSLISAGAELLATGQTTRKELRAEGC